ncbi:MAG TPA: acyl-CoA dehydrogenase [Geminicoccaceae bacterium]
MADHDRLIRRQELDFLLFDLLEVERLLAWPRFREHDRSSIGGVLDAAAALAASHFLTHDRKSDRQEPRLENGRVLIVPEVKHALQHFADAGFLSAHHDHGHGGLQLPWAVAQAGFAHFQAANVATFAYPFLTIAGGNLLARFGSENQKRRYLPGLLSGRFFGTMAMSEPEVGSSLGDIRTTAAPAPDGTYRLRGTKMWISCGEHDLAPTIVHLVLGRIEGAPPGPKGLSLFIVPKHAVGPDGAPGARNEVACVGLNHKMGYRGAVNTVLAFGEGQGARAELIGGPGQGLAIMFHMMNEARIGVGMSAVALASRGYLASLRYAKERRQGRPPDLKDRAAPPVPIIAHADVRRLLLKQKAVAEGGLALGLFLALQVDRQRFAPDPSEQEEAARLLDLLTPVFKAFFSDQALAANDAAIQVLGGYGYSSDFEVEQLWRDNRLNPIHEGTNGIQAIDLLGRKVLGGAGALECFVDLANRVVAACGRDDELAGLASELAAALDLLERVAAAARMIHEEEGPRLALAHASAFMDLAGRVVLAWVWLWQASAARRTGHPLASSRLTACRYVFTFELPPIHALARPILGRDRLLVDLDEAGL